MTLLTYDVYVTEFRLHSTALPFGSALSDPLIRQISARRLMPTHYIGGRRPTRPDSKPTSRADGPSNFRIELRSSRSLRTSIARCSGRLGADSLAQTADSNVSSRKHPAGGSATVKPDGGSEGVELLASNTSGDAWIVTNDNVISEPSSALRRAATGRARVFTLRHFRSIGTRLAVERLHG